MQFSRISDLRVWLPNPYPYDKVRNSEGGRNVSSTVTSKGQITIPVDVRQALRIEAGDRVEFVQVKPGRFELVLATRSVKDLKGMFGKSSKVVSVQQMNQAIAKRGASAR
jgi:AbrB family looped-hinge helix DNA binding protein